MHGVAVICQPLIKIDEPFRKDKKKLLKDFLRAEE
jgi:hypothetical protein